MITRWDGGSEEGVRLNVYRRAGVRMQIEKGGGLLVTDLLTDPSFSGSVRGAVVVGGGVGGCCSALLFLLRFHPL